MGGRETAVTIPRLFRPQPERYRKAVERGARRLGMVIRAGRIEDGVDAAAMRGQRRSAIDR
jgi:2-hydroxychromene-2-carboxylate isomerase